MSTKIYANARFGLREDTLENWVTNNPVLEKGEPAVISDSEDSRWLKIGDGKTDFNSLPWKFAGGTVADKEYDPTSENAQSGIAVAQAVANISGGADVWEMVESFTVDEEAVIKRTYTDHYKKIVVIVSNVELKVPRFRLTGGAYFWEFNSYTADAYHQVYIFGENVIPNAFQNVYAVVGNRGANPFLALPITDRLGNYATYFDGFQSTTACKVGTTIKVYGVKA